jgi:O-antigen/teichoic acid export membrane protein
MRRSVLSIVGSGEIGSWSLRAGALFARAKQLLADDSDQSVTRRTAGTAFLIRVLSAALIFFSQILLARWMGRYEFGVYVYVWTWVVLVGGLAPLGLAYSTQRFIPEYSERGDLDRLRGFLAGSRWLSFGLGTATAGIGITLILALGDRVPDHYRIPFLLAFACLPIFALSSAQDGVARSYNWFDIALVPGYVAQPLVILAIFAIAHAAGLPTTAMTAMLATTAAIWSMVLVQNFLLRRRLAASVVPGSRRYEVGYWFRTALPLFLVDGFFFLLTYTDILVLQLFVGPADIAVYYAASKTLALIAFIYFAVSAAFAHRFSRYHVAGDREKLEAFVADAVRWTFWPSLAAALVLLALGKPILMLFGAGFDQGYPLLFVLVLGLLARASVGPAERLLNMVGEQRICAVIYATAFATNLVLCFVLVPRMGPVGAAISIATALVVESVLLFVMTKRRLGIHVFFWRR